MGVIRILLAFAVVLIHCSGIAYLPGNIAVESFYMISGFYMSLILNEKYNQKKSSFKLFISNRLLRIFPTYWVVLILTIIFSTIAYQIKYTRNESFLFTWISNYSKLNLSSVGYLAFTNIFLLFQDMALFLRLDNKSGSLHFTRNFYSSNPQIFKFLLIPQAWTIGLELVYYLIAPWLRKRPSWVILTLIAMSLTVKIIFIKSGMYYDPWNYRFFPAELLFFLSGSIAYKLYIWLQFAMDYDSLVTIGKHTLMMVIIIILSYSFVVTKFNVRIFEMIYFLLIFISMPLVFIYSRHSKIDRMIGDLSYPIYIVHMLCIGIINAIHVNNQMIFQVTAIVMSTISAIIINKVIVDRIELYRQNRVLKVADSESELKLKSIKLKN